MNLTQQIDQIMAMLRDFSPLLWEYYSDLKKQGFTDEQAFAIVRDYHKLTIGGNK